MHKQREETGVVMNVEHKLDRIFRQVVEVMPEGDEDAIVEACSAMARASLTRDEKLEIGERELELEFLKVLMGMVESGEAVLRDGVFYPVNGEVGE